MQTEPVYLKLSHQILEQFSNVPINRALPSEHDLGEIFGVNRQTIRAALEELERRWLVRRVKGSGTFRTQRYEYRISRDLAPSFTQTVREAGADPRTRNGKPAVRPATEVERDILGLEPGAKVTVLERVRFIDEMPVSTAVSVLPSALVPRLGSVLTEDGSLDGILRRHYGFAPHRQWSQSRLSSPPSDIAAALGLRGQPPQILLRGLISCTRTGHKLEYVESYLRPDVFDVVTELSA